MQATFSPPAVTLAKPGHLPARGGSTPPLTADRQMRRHRGSSERSQGVAAEVVLRAPEVLLIEAAPLRPSRPAVQGSVWFVAQLLGQEAAGSAGALAGHRDAAAIASAAYLRADAAGTNYGAPAHLTV